MAKREKKKKREEGGGAEWEMGELCFGKLREMPHGGKTIAVEPL